MSARREELLTLAEAVLEAEGLETFGLGAVARAASIRPPSLYKHFAGLADLEHALMSRGFLRLATTLDAAANARDATNHPETKDASASSALAAFARAYRAHALTYPQLYRLMTERPLDRSLLIPGSEEAAMRALINHFGESNESHDRARAAWAAAHGLVSLELAGRFPPGSDLDATWAVYTSAFTR